VSLFSKKKRNKKKRLQWRVSIESERSLRLLSIIRSSGNRSHQCRICGAIVGEILRDMPRNICGRIAGARIENRQRFSNYAIEGVAFLVLPLKLTVSAIRRSRRRTAYHLQPFRPDISGRIRAQSRMQRQPTWARRVHANVYRTPSADNARASSSPSPRLASPSAECSLRENCYLSSRVIPPCVPTAFPTRRVCHRRWRPYALARMRGLVLVSLSFRARSARLWIP